MNFKERMYEQLAIDLACTVKDLKSNKNVFIVAERNSNMRCIKGIATALVATLKNKIIDLNVLPYYSTAVSHVISQKVAIKAGFIQVFTELVTMTESVKKSL